MILLSEDPSLGAAVLESQRDGALDGMLVLSTTGDLLTFNRHFVEMWGLPLDTLTRQDEIARHNAAQLVEPAQILARSGAPVGPEYRDELSLKDGRVFERHSLPVNSADGTPYGRMIFFRDVSETKRAEQALRASEHRLRTLLGVATGILFELDGDGRCLEVWTSDEGLLTRPRNEITGRILSESLGETVARPFLEVIRRVHATGKRELIEYVLDVRNGRRWFAAEIDRAPAAPGEAPTVIVAAHDITARHLAFLEHQRLAVLVEATSDAVVGLSPEGRWEDWNHGAEVMFGYSAAEIRGQHVSLLWPKDLQGTDILARLQAGAPVINQETVRLHKNGTPIDVSVSCTPIRDDAGKLLRISSILRDISEQKRLRAQLVVSDRLASVGTLAAGVAHEINNPLAYVSTNLSFLTEQVAHLTEHCSELGPQELRRALGDLREALDESQHGVRRASHVVRDLKTFARGNDGLIELVDLRDVLDASLEMAHNEIRHRAQLARDYQPVPRVLGNEGRIGQALLNLVVNAAQAITEGAAEHNHIRVSTLTDELGRAVVEVADTGSGIPPEHLARIFDPFFTTKAIGVGTGLGLAICHGIVTGLGGEITVASTPGHGTRFRIVLPPAPAGMSAGAKTVVPDPSPAHRLRLLVVDDEPALRRAITRAMRSEHDVRCAANGRDALELLAQDDAFDVILTDVMMPEVSGIDLYQALADKHPALASRLVFMTGGAFTTRAHEFLASVPNPTLAKPFTMAELRALLLASRAVSDGRGATG